MNNGNSERRVTRASKNNKPTRRRVIAEIDVDERENVEIEPEILKQTELFDDDNDISGMKLYEKPEIYKKGAMLEKAKSFKLSKNVNSIINLEKRSPCKTPTKKKKEKSFMKGLSSSEESESKSEGSEYEPDGVDDDDDSDEIDDEEYPETEEIDENEDSDYEVKPKPLVLQKSKLILKKNSNSAKKVSHEKPAYKDLHLNPEDFFENQSEKVLTSNRTLGRLKTQKLDKEKIDELLQSQLHISDAHNEGICRLEEANKSQFPLWLFLLEEGFSILLHGLGSKRELIHDFHQEMIGGCPTLLVNGFFPSLTLKEILDGILKDLMGLEPPTGLNDCMELIEKTLKDNPKDRLYLLIHNIDGPMLRSSKVQDKLSYLASFPNLHLVASVDHINASLLWDNAKRSRYNFYWCQATTFLPYKEETLYENSLMVRQSGALALSSLHNVFLSLPDKSRSVYTILVNYQIENGGANYQGMAFKDLYKKAREGFFVTNDVTLRAQLTEFLDHKLVKVRRALDGIEYLNIPLDNALLKQFLEQQEES
ncbi:origin recognition complex subunit 2 [Belonocnema kinseyi]|uniref:origin recognition complex subunit 2 n=1 Tax=Belonocnema kinseyi TaxID=2817044 RepID=UPI00143D87BD|nr:origin recognition complex subunit 2 [Belonocnema kinseyi]